MKQLALIASVVTFLALCGCAKSTANPGNSPEIPASSPRTNVPQTLQGNWMYGYFSMTDYFSQNPSTHLGPGFEMAIAFTFSENGLYTQYFTSKTVTAGLATYHQSLTHGTVEVDPQAGIIKTHPVSSHYKRTRLGTIEEDRDMREDEMSAGSYSFTTGKEPNGTNALYLKLQGTSNPLTFLQK